MDNFGLHECGGATGFPTSDIARAMNESRSIRHPRGLAFLVFTEALERFSFYGLRGILVLFLVQYLLLPGHVENVFGMSTLRATLEGIYGPLSPRALGSLLFGFFGGAIYLTPLIGGWIADRWASKRLVAMLGLVLMTVGHVAMMFDASVLLALLLLILGSGGLKANIAAQVGQLYARTEESRSARGFAIFTTGINAGALSGPVIAGLVAQIWGWQVGFGVTSAFMLVALAVFTSGYHYLSDDRLQRTRCRLVHPGRSDRSRICLLLAAMAISIPQTLVYDQFSNVGFVWLADYLDPTTPFGRVPLAWFNAIDAATSIAIAPLLVVLWARTARYGHDLGDLTKIGIGAAIQALACLMLAACSTNKVGLAVPVLAFMSIGIAFMWQWPVLLSLVSREAPEGANASMIGLVYGTTFVADLVTGSLGTLYEGLGPARFWVLHAAISAIGTLAVLSLGRWLHQALNADAVAAANATQETNA